MTTDDSKKNHILNQVHQKKQRAYNLNLVNIAQDLYPELKSLHLTLMHEDSHWKKVISEARCMQDDLRFTKIMFKMTNGNEYTVVYSKNDSMNDTEIYDDYVVTRGYEFLLYVGEQKVLGVTFERESEIEMPASYYRALDISAFIEGNWIKDLQELHRVERAYTNSLLSKIEDEGLENLKRDFEIE